MYDGYRLLWVLGKYLSMTRFPHGRLSDMNFEICAQVATTWLFGCSVAESDGIDHLERLLSFNPQLTFDLLVQFFEPEVVEAIMKNEEYSELFAPERVFAIIQRKCK